MVRTSRLPNLTVRSIISAILTLSVGACGRKGDPIPRLRAAPRPASIRWASHRVLEVRLPTADSRGSDLVGIEKVRVFYLPLGSSRPTAEDVVAHGEVILERARPDLPGPGGVLTLDMRQIERSPGWIVCAALRVGDVVGKPSEPLAWLDPSI
jgi:hypothetical protein